MGDPVVKISGPFELCERGSSRAPHSNSFLKIVNTDQIAGPMLEPPIRNYSCKNYENCLDLAAALNWENFTCAQCEGEINAQLMKKAKRIAASDSLAHLLLDQSEEP